jgi:hypothetical protein
VNLAEALALINQDADPAERSVVLGGKPLRASIETAVHSVLPHRVVLHVHSVNIIAWAVRRDGRAELESQLKGIAGSGSPMSPQGFLWPARYKRQSPGLPAPTFLCSPTTVWCSAQKTLRQPKNFCVKWSVASPLFLAVLPKPNEPCWIDLGTEFVAGSQKRGISLPWVRMAFPAESFAAVSLTLVRQSS